MGTGLADAAVGYAMLFNILHIEDPVGLLQEARRVLAPGGLGRHHSLAAGHPDPAGAVAGTSARPPTSAVPGPRTPGWSSSGRGFVLLLLALGAGDAPPVASLCTPRAGTGRLELTELVWSDRLRFSPRRGEPPQSRRGTSGGAGGPGLSPRLVRPEMRTTRARGRCRKPGWSCFVGERTDGQHRLSPRPGRPARLL